MKGWDLYDWVAYYQSEINRLSYRYEWQLGFASTDREKLLADTNEKMADLMLKKRDIQDIITNKEYEEDNCIY